jgi:GNAT superfamily N-acetyltransferase
MAEAETWVRSRGCNQLALTTHLRRTEAHEFYRRLGYEETGKRFVRKFR